VAVPVNRYGKKEVGYFDFLYYPLKEENGEISGLIVTVTEVSEKVEARKKTEQNQERLKIVVDASELGTAELNFKTGIATYSMRYLEILGGYTEYVDLTHEQLLQHIHPEDLPVRNRAFEDAIVTGHLHFETRVIWKDKSIHWMEAKGKVFYDKEHHAESLIGTVRDITNVKNHEQELDKQVKERTEQLQRSNEDLQQFAHVASHDLKEPLRKIKIFTNRIKEEHADSLSAPVTKFLEKIMSASSRMQMMVDGVLSYSSLNATEQPIQKIDLNRTFKHLKSDLEIVIEQKKASILSDELPVIEGAEILINQLFYNLLHNALKFSKESEAPVIEIRSRVVNKGGKDFVKISVKDNGIGFDINDTSKIFETFVRLNSKDEFEGTGLGLSLCKKIVERHHGRIEAESRVNEGATFIITLPIKQTKTHI
jgi:PAS domain S-box-containing protein